MATIRLELVSPERILYSGETTIVITRTLSGELAFQPGHAPFLGVLAIHVLRFRTEDGVEHAAAVHGGFVEVSHNRVTVLSDAAELAPDIDRARAERARDTAEQQLRVEHNAECSAALQRAHARLAAAGGLPMVRTH